MVRAKEYYLEKEILQGSSLDHLVLLYNKAINLLKSAQKSIEKGLNDPDLVKTKANSLSKALDIIIYLQAILDLEKGGEIAKNLQEIYAILIDELVAINFNNDLKKLQDSIEILENLKRAWIALKEMKAPNNKGYEHFEALRA